jgi:transcriptional regulator with XRE-family HTH domain
MLVEEIKKQIITRLREKNLNITDLERKAGLAKGAVSNIIHKTSNNPGIASLEAMARVLECSLDELVGRKYSNQSLSNINLTKGHELIEGLLSDTLNYAVRYIKEQEYTVTFEKLLFLLKESYTYSLEKGSHEVDKKFLEWLIEKNTD